MKYEFDAQLVQLIANTLGMMPANQTRGILNAIEQTCIEQDKQAEANAASAREKELREMFSAEQAVAETKRLADEQAVALARQTDRNRA